MTGTSPSVLASLASRVTIAAPAAGGPLIGRRTGQRLARHELAEMSIWQRVIDWLWRARR